MDLEQVVTSFGYFFHMRNLQPCHDQKIHKKKKKVFSLLYDLNVVPIVMI